MQALTKALSIIILLSSSFCAHSQEPQERQDSEDYEIPITLQTLLETNGRGNFINLVQTGVLNHAYLLQSGHDNSIELDQVGLDNQANITQYGDNNEVELLQVGVRNQADITQIGNDNLVQLDQLGSANFSIEQIADGAAITITQY
ncbi:curlin [Shewanella psychropiezotolerans]|uniref:Curlin n=1 Tax=Shewanella psychropiezotolerans TaxID=2593655 RepID=A0ABX5X3J7_9GAMM|nr:MULTISPECIES: curlin [Shewanella]MPY26169.1 curlin [Shewanella sp. YLB-07]QDO85786.1 curlin [Shewanella psychropiezotolerans]